MLKQIQVYLSLVVILTACVFTVVGVVKQCTVSQAEVEAFLK